MMSKGNIDIVTNADIEKNKSSFHKQVFNNNRLMHHIQQRFPYPIVQNIKYAVMGVSLLIISLAVH